jgi:hypothetical protein
MGAGRRNDNDQLDQNVARLLSGTPPERPLPREAKQRILSALTERAKETCDPRERRTRGVIRNRRMTWNRPVSLAAAAAIVIVVALIALWPGGMQGGLAWADVAQHLADVESVIVWAAIETTSPSGETQVTYARLFQQDPGLSRTETFSGNVSPATPGGPVPPEAIDSIVLMSRSPKESVVARLFPRERRGQRTTLGFSGKTLENRQRLPRDLVAEMFGRLRGLTEDQTRIVGAREIEGLPAVGFAAKMTELLGDSPAPPPDGKVLVWASRETALPLEIEVEFTDPAGTAHRTTYGPIDWNAPLPGELFEIPETDDWEIVDETVHEVGFFRTSLGESVTLSIGPAGGPPIMTERDVAAVLSARAVREPGADSFPRTMIFMTLTPEGAQRVHSYTAAHVGESLTVDFNGESRYEIRIGGAIGAEMRIDVSALGLTPEQFEERYLTD